MSTKGTYDQNQINNNNKIKKQEKRIIKDLAFALPRVLELMLVFVGLDVRATFVDLDMCQLSKCHFVVFLHLSVSLFSPFPHPSLACST